MIYLRFHELYSRSTYYTLPLSLYILYFVVVSVSLSCGLIAAK